MYIYIHILYIYIYYIYTIIQSARQVAYKYGKQLWFPSLCRLEQETIEDLNTGWWLKNHLESYESMVFRIIRNIWHGKFYHSCSKASTRIQKLKLLFNQLGRKNQWGFFGGWSWLIHWRRKIDENWWTSSQSSAVLVKSGECVMSYLDVGQNGRPRGPQMLV